MRDHKSDLVILQKGREQKAIRILNLGDWEISGYGRSGCGIDVDGDCLLSEVKAFDEKAVAQQEVAQA